MKRGGKEGFLLTFCWSLVMFFKGKMGSTAVCVPVQGTRKVMLVLLLHMFPPTPLLIYSDGPASFCHFTQSARAICCAKKWSQHLHCPGFLKAV